MNEVIPDTPECVSHHLGAWCMAPGIFPAAAARLLSGSVLPCSQEELDRRGVFSPEELTLTERGTLVLPLSGVMQKAPSKFPGFCSTLHLRKCLRYAAKSEDVKAVLIVCDSPGGAVNGQSELLSDLDALKSTGKPVWVHIDGMCASAAYWFASHCDMICANDLSTAGSIGCFCVLLDETKKLEREGLRPVVISSGANKGLGADGSVPEELEACVRERVLEISEKFLADVNEHRGGDFTDLADGRLFSAEKALESGLIDCVCTSAGALAALEKGMVIQEEESMPEEKKELEQFQSLADAHGYEFAKAHWGESPEAIASALAERDRAALEGRIHALEVENDELKAELAAAEVKLSSLPAGAAPAAMSPALNEKKKTRAEYKGDVR